MLSTCSRRVLATAVWREMCMWTAAEAVRVSGDRPGWRTWAALACVRLPCRVWASKCVVSRALASDSVCLVDTRRTPARGMLGVSACRSTSKLLYRTLMVVGMGHILYISTVGLVAGGPGERHNHATPQPSPRRLLRYGKEI